jgi:hypothetical protein
MPRNNLCAAIEALEEFQAAHRGWQFVENETEVFKTQLKGVLHGIESLIADMEKVETEEKIKERGKLSR